MLSNENYEHSMSYYYKPRNG